MIKAKIANLNVSMREAVMSIVDSSEKSNGRYWISLISYNKEGKKEGIPTIIKENTSNFNCALLSNTKNDKILFFCNN